MIVHLSVAGIILPCSCFSFNCRVETLLKQALRYSHLVKSCKYASSRLHAHVHPEWRGCGKMALIASGWQHLSGTYLIHLKLKPQRGRGLQGPIIKFHGVDFSKKMKEVGSMNFNQSGSRCFGILTISSGGGGGFSVSCPRHK